MRCARRAGQPRLERGEQLAGVDRLRDVVVGARRRGSAGVRPAAALPVTAMIGSASKPLDRRIARMVVVAVHDRHHDVHQHDVDVGRALQRRDRLGAALGDGHVGLPRSRSADIAKMLRKSSSTTRIRTRRARCPRWRPAAGRLDAHGRRGRVRLRRPWPGARRICGSQGRSAARSSDGSTGLGT